MWTAFSYKTHERMCYIRLSFLTFNVFSLIFPTFIFHFVSQTWTSNVSLQCFHLPTHIFDLLHASN